MKNALRRWTLLAGLLLVSRPLIAGFASAEVFLPAVGRVPGNGGAQFFTTVWATNLTGVAENFKFEFLKQGQANGSPPSFSDTLAPGETKVYENVVETRLGLASAIGAARVTSSGEIFVSERIFDQPPGADLGDTQGLFFAGVPKAFSISLGQSASIQGLNQGGAENFRYNFALVETGGGSPTVNVQVFDGSGALLGQKAFTLLPFEQLQPNVAEVVPGFSSINARITATVTDGSGLVLLAGAQLANISQDSSGFEMSFRDDLLGGGGGAGVTSLNGLTGAVTLASGSNVTITPSGNTLTISAAAGGGSGGLASVFHNATLAGNGTGASPLGVAIPLSLESVDESALDVAMTANSGAPTAIAVSVDGSTNGKAAGITVEVSGTLTNNDATAIHTSVAGQVRGIVSISQDSPAVVGEASGKGTGVIGSAVTGNGVNGFTTSGSAGVSGFNSSLSVDTAGVRGQDGTGSSGQTGSLPAGVLGESKSAIGVQGRTATGVAAVRGLNSSSGNDTSGVFGRDGTGTAGVSGALSAGVRGESATNIGVIGLSNNFSVVGRLGGVGPGVQGELGSVRESHRFAVYSFGDAKFNGTMTATGTKSFVEPHPSDPTKEIRFVCLEGPESGTYFRGRGHFQGGVAAIDVPESFRSVTDADGLTVVATPVGGPAVVWVAKLGLDRIVLQASSDVEFHYVVNGVRKAYKDFQPIHENESFVPDGPQDRRFAFYAPEIQQRLVATGIYNADGTVNLETAKRLGWDKHWPESREQ